MIIKAAGPEGVVWTQGTVINDGVGAAVGQTYVLIDGS
jgi:hypothetical protein